MGLNPFGKSYVKGAMKELDSKEDTVKIVLPAAFTIVCEFLEEWCHESRELIIVVP